MIGTSLDEIKNFFSLLEDENSNEKKLQFLLSERNKIDIKFQSLVEGKEFLDTILEECYSYVQ